MCFQTEIQYPGPFFHARGQISRHTGKIKFENQTKLWKKDKRLEQALLGVFFI